MAILELICYLCIFVSMWGVESDYVNINQRPVNICEWTRSHRDAKRAGMSPSIQNPLADWSRNLMNYRKVKKKSHNFHLCHICSVISCFEKFRWIHDPEKKVFFKFYTILIKQRSFRLFPWLTFSTAKEPFSTHFVRWSQDNGEGGERWCWKGQDSEATGRGCVMGGGVVCCWHVKCARCLFPSVYYEITMEHLYGSLRYIIWYNNNIYC